MHLLEKLTQQVQTWNEWSWSKAAKSSTPATPAWSWPVPASTGTATLVGRVAKGSDHIAEIDILRSYLGLLCLGKSDYQAIAAMREDDYFKQAPA